MELERLSVRDKFLCWADGITNWTTKADFTFSWECNEFDAKKKFEKWKRKTLPSSTCLYAIERDPNQEKVKLGGQGLNQSVHIHSIMDTNWHFLKRGGVTRTQIWRDWKNRFGVCRIEPVRIKKDALGYCMKKVFGYSEAREVPGRVCRRGTTEWNLLFGLGKAGRLARERAKSIEVPEWNVEMLV